MESALIYGSHLTTHREAYLTNLSNLIITYNRIGRFEQGKQLKMRIDSIRSLSSQPQIEQEELAISFPTSPEKDLDSVSTDMSDDLFATEGDSQMIKKVPIYAVPDSSEESSDDEEHGNLDVLAEMEVACDKVPMETVLQEQEEALKSKIALKSGNPKSEAKIHLQLGEFYERSGRYSDAVNEYRCIQSLIGNSRETEELYHLSSRRLGVSLRELGELKESVRVLNKDVDVLVYRRGRCMNREYGEYYDSELCRSCEELGNSLMR